MTHRIKMAAGNWKMNGTSADLQEIAKLQLSYAETKCDVLICPPATLLDRMSQQLTESPLMSGGQDCHVADNGPHTGEVSAAMLKDAGAEYVILGHSDRRIQYDEENEDVRAKAKTALTAGLKVLICVGESENERAASNTLDIIGGQLAGSIPDLVTGENLVVAYEPIWAIGTGKIPTLDQIGEVHDFIRARLERRLGEGVGRSTRILYGGSVKPDNARDIFQVSNVDGALVGGASLKAADFALIIDALYAS